MLPDKLTEMQEKERQLLTTDESVQQRGLAKYQLESLCLEMKNSKYERFLSPEGWSQHLQVLDDTLEWLR